MGSGDAVLVQRRSQIAGEALVLAGYALLALLLTYPLGLHLGSYVVGLEVDAEEYLWSFWWMNKAVGELGANPYFTNWLYYPTGVSLYFFASNPLHAFLSVPLQRLFGLITAYNLMALLAIIASGYSAYWLCRDVVGSRAAAFVGGVLFAFAPTQIFHLEVGQPNLSAVEFLPLYMLCVRRWVRGGGVRWLLAAVIALALNSFADWQFAVYCQLFTGMLLLAELVARRATLWVALRSLVWRTAALQVLFLATILPVLLPMLAEITGPQPYMVRKRSDTVYHSADLLAFLVPNPMHPLWRDWAEPLRRSLQVPDVLVTVVSLSYVALALALVALWRAWPQARFWLITGLCFVVFAMGPELLVGGHSTGILLPYELLFQLPIIKISRAPARYVTLALACLAVLAALGTKALLEGLTPSRRMLRMGGTMAMVGAMAFELLPAPLHAHAPATPPSFFVDGTLNNAGALLEVPNPSNRGMGYAVLHGRPVVYGELSRDNPGGPLLEYIRDGIWTNDIVEDRSSWQCIYGMFNITHAVVYPPSNDSWKVRAGIIGRRLGPDALVAATPQGTLYRLPTTPPGATCVLMGDGWQGIRPFDNGTIYRWGQQATTVGLIRTTPGRARLHFTAHSFAIERTLEIRQGDKVVGSLHITGSPQPYSVDVDLSAGMTWLELRSQEPAISPADYGYREKDPIAVGFSQIWVEPLLGARGQGLGAGE